LQVAADDDHGAGHGGRSELCPVDGKRQGAYLDNERERERRGWETAERRFLRRVRRARHLGAREKLRSREGLDREGTR